MIEFNLGTLVYTMSIIKAEPEDSLVDNIDPEKRTKVINYNNMHIDITNQLDNKQFQEIINQLEPGQYKLSIELNNENFKKLEQVEGEILNDKS